MSAPFIGQIMLFVGDYAPAGWLPCDGRVLNIRDNPALFSVLGNRYGGDGRSTFALPNLADRAAMHWGSGPGLQLRKNGELGGERTVALKDEQNPEHAHHAMAAATPATTGTPGPTTVWAGGVGSTSWYRSTGSDVALADEALGSTGDGAAHNNVQPCLSITPVIAISGVYPAK